jgi:Tfp pilus assembly protein PilX
MTRPHQRGIVLGAVLVLLLLLTLLGVAGLTAAVAALAMSSAGTRTALAFEAAEAGIARASANATYDATTELITAEAPLDPATVPGVTVEIRVAPVTSARVPVLPEGFSLAADGAGFEALPFEITATGRAARAVATHVQGFYVIVPPTS